jgi:hypothetical protein
MSLVPVLLGWPLLLGPIHVVFLELIIDPVSSIVFEAELEEAGVMARPPRNPKAPLFDLALLARGLLQGVMVLVATLAMFLIGVNDAHGEEAARGMAFVTLVLGNLGLVLANRSMSSSTPRRNWRLGWAGCAGPSRICHSVLESELSTWVAIGVNPAAMRVDPSRSGGKNLVAAHKASPMQLSAEHERELNSLVRAHSTPQKLAERARIILLAAAGLGVEETAQQLGIWRKTAGHWRRRWRNADAATGVAARLSDASRCGAPATFTPEVICQIMALACEDPETLDVPINHWSQSELARQSVARGIVKNISHGSVGRFLKKRPISNRTATATG